MNLVWRTGDISEKSLTVRLISSSKQSVDIYQHGLGLPVAVFVQYLVWQSLEHTTCALTSVLFQKNSALVQPCPIASLDLFVISSQIQQQKLCWFDQY